MNTYFHNDFVSIRYIEDNHTIICQWLVAPTSSEMKEGSNMVISAMHHFKTGKIVWDTRNLGALHPDDQQWAAVEYYNNAIKAGYSHAAFVIPQDVFTQMSVEDTMSQVAGAFPMAYFDNLQEAVEWIKVKNYVL